MIWGYALVWPHQWFEGVSDPFLAKLHKLDEYGLKTMHASASELEAMEREDPRRLDRILNFLCGKGLCLTLGLHADVYRDDDDAIRADVDRQLGLLMKWAPIVGSPIVHTGGGPCHRFTRNPSLEQQMERLHRFLGPAAEICWEIGSPLCIENHGDYYVSDLVELCRATRFLHIFLDTGNTYLIGEKPLAAFEEAAPFVMGGHFKDHYVGPVTDKALHFGLSGAVLGEGDVPLEECIHILACKSPYPHRVAMLIELIPPSFKGNDNIDAFEKSVSFALNLRCPT